MHNKKIYIAGHTGLVGSSLKRVLERKGYKNILVKTHNELDLTDLSKVQKFFEKESPDWVFVAAAKVGGIIANNTYPVEFMLENMKIQNNIIECAYKNNVEKLLFMGSSCIYPKVTQQPIKEEYLLGGALEPTNEGYALSKICGIKLCNAYNREYGTNYIAVMPCSIYGINDHYHSQNSHVIPMLIKRFHEAKIHNDKEVVIWGSGTPRREFLFSDDLAEAIIFIMETKNAKDIGEFVNIGSGEDLPILELANKIKKIVGFEGNLVLDRSKPDGTMQKLLDVEKVKNMGWRPKISLEEGLKLAYKDFLDRYYPKDV